ncbi:UNVERIFIED_CONTAM: hypothetical protein PYX00_008692 [Menopon gallinae]|uniref:RNA helicase n=1 Tax=Menopon gallinae TaxID=328185 RepID=A0AAW2HQD4_9NEOP
MPKKKNSQNLPRVSEDVRIAVDVAIKNFLVSELTEMEFPSSLTAEERAYIHKLAYSAGLHSKSRGRKANRYITVYKREGSTIVQADAQFQLSPSSRQIIQSLLNKYPLSNKERQDLLPQTDRDRIMNPDLKEMNKSLGRLPAGIAQIPPAPGYIEEIQQFKQNLPIWPYRDEIIRTISNNQVCIIEGETGSGKTTQVPQFILENCRLLNKPCRVIVTEPRRIAAVSVCERVCLERDEKVGQNIGYQIRLESRISPKTVVTFCTSGVLLRTLMCGESTMGNVTHIVVDEVHERDRYCDFLLIALRDLLTKFRNLHLILMSATLNSETFSKYFMNCPVISVPGRQFPVKEYFLEDVLKLTGYMSEKMLEVRRKLKAKNSQKKQLEIWKASISNLASTSEEISSGLTVEKVDVPQEKSELEPWLIEEMDNAISEAFLNGTEESMMQLLHIILSENVSPDYQHSKTSVTPLMVAAVRNSLNMIEQLLTLGANIWIKASNDLTAIDWANFLNHKEAAELIQSYHDQSVRPFDDPSVIPKETSLSDEDQELLEIYQNSFNDDNTDINLLMSLLTHIHCTKPKGAILVFLAGYHEIVSIRERILSEDKKLSEHMKYVVYILHSSMQTGDQRKVFKPTAYNVRKIILSTNIAETSLTIDDVIYVIDSGKVREKTFDAINTVCSLTTCWISRDQAQQRKGRAGRSQPGICYHLFSSFRYNKLDAHSTPEILRVPLQDLCLHSKLLAPSNTPIADFLSRAIDPPPFLVTRNAVQFLKTIDVLDSWEDLTELGVHVLDLPVEPRLAKMLMYSCVLKCLDPVLTIVCCLTYKEPFILPAQPAQKCALKLARKKFSANTFSDHMVLLRAFQGWQQARNSGWERAFCEKNFISAPTMDMVTGIRAQLLAQLRASGFIRSRSPGDIRDLNSNSENWAVVKAALCAGIYPNLARVDREQAVMRTKKEWKVAFHPSSALRNIPKDAKMSVAQSLTAGVESLPTDWIMFDELNRTGRLCFMKTCTLVSPITVAIFSGPARLPLESVIEAEDYRPDDFAEPDSDSEVEEKSEQQTSTLKIDDWVLFKVDTKAAHLALQLRQKWHSLFLRRMKAPGKLWTQSDEAIVKTIVSVLTAEEQALNLTQPPGVGQRPRPCNIDHGRDEEYYSSSQNLLFSNEGRSNKKLGNIAPNQPNKMAEGFDPKYLTDDPSGSERTKYFIIKAQSFKAIENSIAKETWTFSPMTERRLTRALKDGKEVILIFSVQGSGYFQGIAKLINADSHPNSCNQMKLQWIKRGNISFQATRFLLNPLNQNKRVQTSRDGQEIEASVGAVLCSLWDKAPSGGKSNVPEDGGVRPIRGFVPHPGCDFQIVQRNQK